MSLSFRLEIPMDVVIYEILTRLPAKSLMRFKCVSKLLASLTISRFFNNRFLTVPSSSPRIYMCLAEIVEHRTSVILSSAPSSSSSFVVDHDLTIPRLGSDNLQNIGGFMFYVYWRKPRIYNDPTTRQLLTLPFPKNTYVNLDPGPGEPIRLISYYFGHDPFNDQYKVVCSICECMKSAQEIVTEHWIFVVKAGGSWKKAQSFFPHVPVNTGLCIDGVIYYIGYIDINFNKSVLVSFDVRSEEFKMIRVPRRSGDKGPRRVLNATVVEYGGKVSILDQTYLREKGTMDLWVLEDGGNQKWSRKTLVLKPSQLPLVNGKIRFNVKCRTQSGKVLLIPEKLFDHFYILCYDLQSNDLRKIRIKGIPKFWYKMKEEDICFDVMFMDQSESVIYLET